ENGVHGEISSHVEGSDGGERFKREMRELNELLTKLNPMAKEFVPPSLTKQGRNGGFFTVADSFLGAAGYFPLKLVPLRLLLRFGLTFSFSDSASFVKLFDFECRFCFCSLKKKKPFGPPQGKWRINPRTSMAQREDVIRRTVYVSDIDQQVTEEQLAGLFIGFGHVVDCRICGDPNSVLRFAFIEFTDEVGAKAALNLSGTILGFYHVKVMPSKTAIALVNPTFLPRTEDEREKCARTIYCTNIDKKVTQTDIKLFFEAVCGEVLRLRLLGDYHHPTRIGFVELNESAITALNCSGVLLGSLPIRVSPSKKPVRSCAVPRQQQ
ncbi:hypothetical protein F2Q70_00003332, partial [Brassica cretica]